MQLKTILSFFFCFTYFLIQAQSSKVPKNKIPNLSYSGTFSWKPSDKKYGIDAEIEFSLSYYYVENKIGQEGVLVAQNVKITKGNTIYNQGKTYTKQQVGEKAYNQIRLSEVDFKVIITNGTRSLEVFFMDVLPQKEDHVRQFGWADVFYGDYHPDRKPLDNSTTEKYEATIRENKKMLYSSNTRITNVELLDVKSYNIPDDRATRKKENKKKTNTKVATTSNDDFWNGKSDKTVKKKSKNSDNDFWNGKSKKIAENVKEDDFWNGKGKPNVTITVKEKNVKTIKEDEPIIELYNNKLRNIKSKEILFNSILYNASSLFDFFKVYAIYGLESENQGVNYVQYGNYLVDNKGVVLVKEAERIYKTDENIKIWFYKSLVYNKISYDGYGKPYKQYKKNYIIYTYDSQMNLLTKEPFFTYKYKDY